MLQGRMPDRVSNGLVTISTDVCLMQLDTGKNSAKKTLFYEDIFVYIRPNYILQNTNEYIFFIHIFACVMHHSIIIRLTQILTPSNNITSCPYTIDHTITITSHQQYPPIDQSILWHIAHDPQSRNFYEGSAKLCIGQSPATIVTIIMLLLGYVMLLLLLPPCISRSHETLFRLSWTCQLSPFAQQILNIWWHLHTKVT